MKLNRMLLCLAAASTALLAQNTAPLLVEVDWLSAHLNDKNLVILVPAQKADFDAGHIQGARLLSPNDISRPMNHSNPKELSLELPAPADARAKLAALGISDDSRIVVYYGKGPQFAVVTRVVLTLDYLGLGGQTSILNGGLPAWTAAGKPVSTAATEITPGKLSDRPTKAVITDADGVKAAAGQAHKKLVDARAPAYFNGTEPTYEKAGHIPGAVNIPFTDILDSSDRVDKAHIAALFQKAGIGAGDAVVAYCHIGLQATTVVFSARLLGNPVQLYDGAFQDWAINDRGPVEK